MHRVVFFFVFLVCVGCTKQSSDTSLKRDQLAASLPQLDKKKAIEIAWLAVSSNANFRKDEVSFEASRDGHEWWVTVWREPKMPGGFCTVEITDDGKVQHIYPGE